MTARTPPVRRAGRRSCDLDTDRVDHTPGIDGVADAPGFDRFTRHDRCGADRQDSGRAVRACHHAGGRRATRRRPGARCRGVRGRVPRRLRVRRRSVAPARRREPGSPRGRRGRYERIRRRGELGRHVRVGRMSRLHRDDRLDVRRRHARAVRSSGHRRSDHADAHRRKLHPSGFRRRRGHHDDRFPGLRATAGRRVPRRCRRRGRAGRDHRRYGHRLSALGGRAARIDRRRRGRHGLRRSAGVPRASMRCWRPSSSTTTSCSRRSSTRASRRRCSPTSGWTASSGSPSCQGRSARSWESIGRSTRRATWPGRW